MLVLVMASFTGCLDYTDKMASGGGDNEDEKYENLQQEYILQGYELTKVENQYNSLQEELEELQRDYTLLESQYSSSQKELEFTQNVNVGHLMEQGYDDIREIYEDEWGGLWWMIVGDDEDVILFAARLTEHDLGRLYWVDANDKYNSLRDDSMPVDMNQAAFTKLSHVTDYIEINYYDSPVVKTEKILDFVSTWVHYEHDKNNVFLSPVETLTFRSGDCDDFAILVSALFELVGLDSGIVFLTNDEGDGHAMSLLHLDDLGGYGYYYYSDLTNQGFQEGNWIIIEPQSSIHNQGDAEWMEQWSGEHFVEIDTHTG
jgi:hypothetical protein